MIRTNQKQTSIEKIEILKTTISRNNEKEVLFLDIDKHFAKLANRFIGKKMNSNYLCHSSTETAVGKCANRFVQAHGDGLNSSHGTSQKFADVRPFTRFQRRRL